MKAREAFDKIRRQKVGWLNLRTRMILLVSAELLVSILLALGLATLIDYLFDIEDRYILFVAFTITSLLIGSVVTSFISKIFFDPIKKLRSAMEKVADGDFKVRLDEKTSSREMNEIYSGFNLMVHELSATEILQTDFVSNVSHEFKTPINAIEGYATLLQGCDGLDADQKDYIDKIYFNTKRLSSLVGNILLLSKIDNQAIQSRPVRFRLDEQIRQSIVILEPAWEKKETEFDVELESIEFTGHEALLHHVWDNLISNAIKFGPQGGIVRIRLTRNESSVVFSIEDNGPGISEEAKKHIFDKFYQADSSHKGEGNGLGLALVKQILSVTGGSICVENLECGGCRFTVVLTEAGK